MKQVLIQLESIRRRARTALIVNRVSMVATGILLLGTILMLLDYVFRFPRTVRTLQLIPLAILIGIAWHKLIQPAICFHPGLPDLALRIERWIPSLTGQLASSVEFALAGFDKHSPLADRIITETARTVKNERMSTIVRYRPMVASLSIFLLLFVLALIPALSKPTHTSIALTRLLWPITDATWPKHTLIHGVMDDTVAPRGRVLSLKAEVTKGHKPDLRVTAHYRFTKSESSQQGEWQTAILTHQHENLYERLIEPNRENSGHIADQLEVWYEAGDDQTAVQIIHLVDPPAITHATLSIKPPSYAQDIIPPSTVQLRTLANDRESTVSPLLQGSQVELTLHLNKPIPIPYNESIDWKTTIGWSSKVNLKEQAVTFEALPETANQNNLSSQWIVRWTAMSSAELHPTLIDQYGIISDRLVVKS